MSELGVAPARPAPAKAGGLSARAHIATRPPLAAAVRSAFADGFALPVILLAIFAVQIARGVWLLPEGYGGAGALNTSLVFLLILWGLGMMVRAVQPGSRLASGLCAIALFLALSIFSALAAAANAIGGGDFVDPWLAAIDATLFPFYDWKAVAFALTDYPKAYFVLNHVYGSLSWQPLVFMSAALVFGTVRDLGTFVSAWGLGLLGCILPFHWFPAMSPYGYYGIQQGDVPGHMVSLPWSFLPVLEGMRDGSIRAIEMQCLTGMVTIPSFHACAATILALSFWRFAWLRWPFLALNIGMALAAVPIGSHYVIDIVAGIAVGVLAVIGARRLNCGSGGAGGTPAALPPRAGRDQKGRSLPV